MIKKVINTALTLSLLAGAGLATSADAASYTYKNSKGFTSAWSAYNSGTNWIIKYGFNTDWINEDYTHTTHAKYKSYAIVNNANGKYSSSASAGNWAKTEVRHSGTSISYTIQF
ncbi:hypothetical protein [Bacillus sp. ISL-37]|jgi:hypothetical protein|uniref:mediterrocin family bacteriocin n=1 Tax=Bacillus sp. ISL-37 TaxID=2819123 RepID=UPI001BE9E8CE|nr:hypothetical protein [Bacillus sp. ISL-37]MBT2685973.1 hypothetical protein [Bacillus sp. ISL-37]